MDDAAELVKHLGVKSVVMPIEPVMKAFEQTMSQGLGMFETYPGDFTFENVQARIRGTLVTSLANRARALVLNTGNKSEAMMGYSTLYGDTAGAYAPIGGLYKTDVYAVSRWVNARAEAAGRVAPIPEHVLVKPPSAELAPGQQDETSLGTTYAELDKLLIDYKERGKSVEQLIAAGYDAAEVERITKRVEAYAFKRALEPPYPDVKFYE